MRSQTAIAVLAAFTLSTTSNFLAAAPPELLAANAAGELPGADDFFSELPVVLSVSRLKQPMKDVPGFVTVIDADDIRHSGARDIAELLRAVPGFQVAFNAYGAPVAAYHGAGSDVPKGLQILIDGRTQYTPMYEGGAGWNIIEVPLEEIDRIEVLRGSNSAAFGSNAFMGVVNIVTRPANVTRGVLVKAGNGNQGILDRHVRIGFGQERWAARLSADTQRDEGVPLFYDSRTTDRVNLRVDFDPTASDSFVFLAGQLSLSLGTGHPPEAGLIRQLTDPNRVFDMDSNFAHIGWRHHWDSAGDSEFKLHRVRQRVEDVYNVAGLGYASTFVKSGIAVRDDLDLKHTVSFDQVRLVGGYGWRQDRAEHAYFFGPGREVEQTIQRLFGQAEWRPIEQLTVNLGATLEDDSISGSSMAHRAALNVHATPTQTIKLIAGRSRRLPTLYESRSDERLYETVGAGPAPIGTLLFVDHSSTGTVKPETVFSTEIGYFGQFKSTGLDVDARWFQEDMRDRILPFGDPLPNPVGCADFEASCGDYFDYYNAISAKIRGWEAQINWQPLRDTLLGLTHTRVKIDTRWTSTRPVADEELSTLDYLARSSPKSSTAITLRQRFLERITLSAAYYDIGAFQWTKNGQTKAYHRFDWRLAYDFKIAQAKAELAWAVRNDGSNHAEWFSSNTGGGGLAELIGTRHFVSLRVDY